MPAGKFRYYYGLFILFALFCSCAFELDDFYDTLVNVHPVAPEIQILELDIEDDTVFVYGERNVNFHFQSSDQDILMIRMLVDGQPVDSIESASGQLKFTNYSFKKGIHELSIEILTESGTGSIADKLHAEGFVLAKKWVMVLDMYSPSDMEGLSVDGFLQLQWKPYRASDFQSYIISRGYYDAVDVGVTDQLQYTDSGYVGEGSTYNVDVRLKDGTRRYWGTVNLSDKIPVPVLSVSDNNNYSVVWKKSPYYNAIGKYIFSVNNVKYESVNISDTVYNLQALFGDNIDFSIQCEPKYKNIYYNTSNYYFFISSSSFRAGIQVNFAHPAASSKHINPGEVAYNDNYKLIVYDIATQKLTREIPIREDGESSYGGMSPRAKYFLGSYSTGQFSRIYFIKNMETGTIVPQTYYESATGGVSQNFVISDVGNGVAMNLNYETGFDFIRNKATFTRFGDTSTGMKISSDGKYYMVNSDSLYIFKIEDTRVTRMFSINTFSIWERDWEFNTVNSNEVTLASDKYLYVYQCEPYKLVNQFSLDAGEDVLFIDYFRNEVLTGVDKKLSIRSLDDWSLLKEIPVSFNARYYEGICLINRYILMYNSLIYHAR